MAIFNSYVSLPEGKSLVILGSFPSPNLSRITSSPRDIVTPPDTLVDIEGYGKSAEDCRANSTTTW
jgi:hypothetical protein